MGNDASNSSSDLIQASGIGSFAERLKLLIKGRSNRQVAEEWGVGASTLNAYLKKGSMPNLNIAHHISCAEGVSLEWLATGEGNIIAPEVNEKQNERILATLTDDDDALEKIYKEGMVEAKPMLDIYKLAKKQLCLLSPEARELISTGLAKMANLSSLAEAEAALNELIELHKEKEEFELVAGYDTQVSAGNGTISENERPCRYLAFRKKWLRYKGFNARDLAIVWAKGDSMQPTIHNNDTMIVHTGRIVPQDGNIYIFRNGDDIFVKRYQNMAGMWRLISDNSLYSNLDVLKEEQHQFAVIGQVVHIAHDL